jgi:hypothetical protein
MLRCPQPQAQPDAIGRGVVWCEVPGRKGSRPHKGAVNSGAIAVRTDVPICSDDCGGTACGYVPELLLDVVVLVQVVDVHEIEDLLSKRIAGS